MTKREKELLEEVSILKDKLDHAQKWMNRQVQETSTSNKSFFERLKRKQSLFEYILSTIKFRYIAYIVHKIKRFHIFRHHYSFIEIWQKRIEAFFVGAAIILFWRGIWNLADQYLFPGDESKVLSAFASLLIGMIILILTRSFVNQFLDEAVEEAD